MVRGDACVVLWERLSGELGCRWTPFPVGCWHLVRGEARFLLCFSAIQTAQSGHLAPLEQRWWSSAACSDC